MICTFDLCELYNILFGGIIVGILASFIFVWITNYHRISKFQRRYKYLESDDSNEFDWEAYSMEDDNGRIKRDEPNGSKMNIQIRDERIFLKVKQIDSRISIGELRVSGFNFGLITFKYENDHEYGKRECVIGSYEEDGKRFDYLFTMPINDKIYYIDTINKDKSHVYYNYGNEIFIRKTAGR